MIIAPSLTKVSLSLIKSFYRKSNSLCFHSLLLRSPPQISFDDLIVFFLLKLIILMIVEIVLGNMSFMLSILLHLFELILCCFLYFFYHFLLFYLHLVSNFLFYFKFNQECGLINHLRNWCCNTQTLFLCLYQLQKSIFNNSLLKILFQLILHCKE